jgi:hypothetical protein
VIVKSGLNLKQMINDQLGRDFQPISSFLISQEHQPKFAKRLLRYKSESRLFYTEEYEGGIDVVVCTNEEIHGHGPVCVLEEEFEIEEEAKGGEPPARRVLLSSFEAFRFGISVLKQIRLRRLDRAPVADKSRITINSQVFTFHGNRRNLVLINPHTIKIQI